MSKGDNALIHNRRSIRVKGYDYTQPGYYFITLVAKNRYCIFGSIAESDIKLNEIGELVVSCWLRIPDNFEHTTLDEFILMPNHLHGIIVIEEAVGMGEAFGGIPQNVDNISSLNASPLQPIGTKSGSLGAIIQNFKSVSTRIVNKQFFKPGNKIWQRNYFERIIRNERELNAITCYIQQNPIRWQVDRENLDAVIQKMNHIP